ncbi:MAG: hypothetical protein HY924_03025 [Elusimicrobia bacterium]|nr:hypothetical protein [Elusimicrobiota bacterium]
MEMGIGAIVMMVVMMGGMLFFGHRGHHKEHKKDKPVAEQAAVAKSTEPAPGAAQRAAPHEEHGD